MRNLKHLRVDDVEVWIPEIPPLIIRGRYDKALHYMQEQELTPFSVAEVMRFRADNVNEELPAWYSWVTTGDSIVVWRDAAKVSRGEQQVHQKIIAAGSKDVDTEECYRLSQGVELRLQDIVSGFEWIEETCERLRGGSAWIPPGEYAKQEFEKYWIAACRPVLSDRIFQAVANAPLVSDYFNAVCQLRRAQGFLPYSLVQNKLYHGSGVYPLCLVGVDDSGGLFINKFNPQHAHHTFLTRYKNRDPRLSEANALISRA